MCYNVKEYSAKVVLALKKLNTRRKRWLESKNRSLMRRRVKYNITHKKRRLGNGDNNYRSSSDCDRYDAKVIAPVTFSIINNSKETLVFFDEVFNKIRQSKYHGSIYFDLSMIEIVTVDAIMYLTALIENSRRVSMMNINCFGNVPENREARTIIEASGFFNHVSALYKYSHDKKNQIDIRCGKESDPVLAKGVCDFVHSYGGWDTVGTRPLYKMIVELMTNTRQHAYQKTQSAMNEKWYLFAENCSGYVNFVFLDTGDGIPSTIRRNFLEMIKNFFNNSDAYFIASALRGEFRTETKLDHRGYGLPEIYQKAKNGFVSDLVIASCQGMCSVDGLGNINEIELSKSLRGTLFCWKLKTHKEQ